jgi:hypothetical protein
MDAIVETRWGPWSLDITDAGRVARLRSMRALALATLFASLERPQPSVTRVAKQIRPSLMLFAVCEQRHSAGPIAGLQCASG